MDSRKGIVYAAIERLDSLMAIGESRREAKKEIRETTGTNQWSVSTGKIHSHTTRHAYQQHILAFINWSREQHQVKRLEQLDARADELATQYLQERKAHGDSSYPLKAMRAALRMFFGNDRELAGSVELPVRARKNITRSRGPKTHDRHANWQPLIRFLQATGLRSSEVRDLRVKDIYYGHDGNSWSLSPMAREAANARCRCCQGMNKTYYQWLLAATRMSTFLRGSPRTWMSTASAVSMHRRSTCTMHQDGSCRQQRADLSEGTTTGMRCRVSARHSATIAWMWSFVTT